MPENNESRPKNSRFRHSLYLITSGVTTTLVPVLGPEQRVKVTQEIGAVPSEANPAKLDYPHSPSSIFQYRLLTLLRETITTGVVLSLPEIEQKIAAGLLVYSLITLITNYFINKAVEDASH